MEPFHPEFLICPSCNHKVDKDHLRISGDGIMGLTSGYGFICPNCHEAHVISFVGKMPLFDLSRKIFISGLS